MWESRSSLHEFMRFFPALNFAEFHIFIKTKQSRPLKHLIIGKQHQPMTI